MELQVIADEGGDEIIGMVVTLLHAQFERLAGLQAGIAEDFRFQLALEKFVGRALIDKDGAGEPRAGADEVGGVVGAPGFLLFPEIAAVNAFCPQGTWEGEEMGEKAETER